MGAIKLLLSSVVVSLFLSGLSRTIAASNTQEGMCSSSACNCDSYGRLTCNCADQVEELILTSDGDQPLSSFTNWITIRNCPSVILMNSSLAKMTNLRSIELLDINNLTLFTESFELSPKTMRTSVSIRSSSIEVLPSYTFRGDMEAISFENVQINLVNAFAFANLAGTETLRLEDCRFEIIEEQAFKKFDVNYLHIIRGTLGSEVPSRAMNDIEVFTTFRLDGVQMGLVKSSAFVIKKPKTVSIQNCIIESLEAGAFDIAATGGVHIKNNTFRNLVTGSFLGIRGDPEDAGIRSNSNYDITFTNNTLDYFEEGSVMFNRDSFKPVIDNVFINRTCDCSYLKPWTNNVLNYTIYSRFYHSFSSQSARKTTFDPIEEGTFLCADDSWNFVSFTEFEGRNCTLGSSIMFLLLGAVGLIVILIIGIGMIIWCCKEHGGHERWMSVPTSAPDVVSQKNGVIGRNGSTPSGPVDSRITMVVPDGRLYRETEFHVIVEKAEPLTTEL
ncbi:uncharacterized protein LOC107045273 [Diachasma alloeum]|uniref:uncharacterized protein LOC107045273 n=1 Tax=Diachasma alloeum TaxID=454923 RepID=UPI0007382984|nr:uncharacterized protein LOC107045273 [Diachasma alloeum]XP_015122964.1 uncharacterized protein LOC107045273 [Diachasma alloeum]